MNFKEKILLTLIILLGFGLRFYGMNFDKTCCQHPDERAIVMFALPLSTPTNFEQFLSPESSLNPHFFAYGNLPLYILKGSAVIASVVNPNLLEYSQINLVGRSISILADLVTIFLVFKISTILYNKKTGLTASFIYSISVLPIQYSHFYTSDILLTMFITLTIFRVLKFYNKPSFVNAILVGIPLGLALATKISAIPIIIAVSAALMLEFIFIFSRTPNQPKHWLPHIPHVLKKLLTEGLLIALTALITFIIVQPYAIIDFGEFIKQNLAQSAMTRAAYTFPYTLQYVGKIPYLYEVKNMLLWGIGPVIFTFTVAGLYLLFKSFKTLNQTKRAESLIVLSFFFLYFLIVGNFAIGFMRYMLPIYPILAIFAGLAIVKLFEQIDNLNKSLKYLLGTFIILLLLVWSLSFMTIYSKTNTRIAATEWINKNIPAGSALTHEVWDDQIPLYSNNNYKFIDLGMYDQPDNQIKWDLLNSKINQADYVVIASNRLSTPIQNLNDCSKYKICYPIGSKFYENLLAGKLNYKKVAEFTSFPTVPILNIPINDRDADESFTVYDHPKITIYKNIKK